MKKISIVFIILAINFCQAQKNEIELPKGYGFEYKFSDTNITPINSVYISKKGTVIFEDEKISVEELGTHLFAYKNKLPVEYMTSIVTQIYADKRTSYKIVNAVKAQLSSALLYNVVYRTDHIEDVTKGLGVRLYKSLIPEKKEVIAENDDVIFIQAVGLDPISQMIEDLYKLDFPKAKQILKEYKYKKIRIYSKNRVSIDGKKIKLSDEKALYNAMDGNDFLLVFPKENISYETYLKNTSILRKSYKKYKKQFILIEISIGLQKILEERNFI